MAEPAKDMMYSGSVDDEINGDFESADKPSGPADISPSESVDAVQDQSGLVQSAKHAAETPDSHMNGHSAQTSHLPNGHDPSADPEEGSTKAASGQQAEPQEEPWKKRLYFVRMPKFPEENQYASKALQEEMDVYRSQVQLLNESLNIVRVWWQPVSLTWILHYDLQFITRNYFHHPMLSSHPMLARGTRLS